MYKLVVSFVLEFQCAFEFMALTSFYCVLEIFEITRKVIFFNKER